MRIAVMVMTILPALATAQSMCVLDPVEAEHLEGAVFFQADGKSSPLPDVTVSLLPLIGRGVPDLATSVSKGDGRFSIEDTSPGRYWLSFRHKALIGFSVEVHLRQRSHRPTAFLVATFGNDPNKPCGGGSVRPSPVVEDACRSLEYENQNQVDYELKLRRIEGTAMDMQSPPLPVPRTCVGLFTENERKLVTTVETDQDGTFAFGRIQPGRYRLVAKHPGLGVANVKLQVGTWHSGRVLDSRDLVIHLRPRAVDATSFVNFSR